jgi:hypothetical protein
MATSADKVAWLEGALHGNLGNFNNRAGRKGPEFGKRAVKSQATLSQGIRAKSRHSGQLRLTHLPRSAAVSHLAWAFGTELVIA